MPNAVAGVDIGTGFDAVLGKDMHVQDVPARLLIAVAIQVLNHSAIRGSYDKSVSDCSDPVLTNGAASNIGGCKIKSPPSGSRIPCGVWSTGVGPRDAALEWQDHGRLSSACGHQGFDRQVK